MSKMKIGSVLKIVRLNIEALKEGRGGIKTSTLSGPPGIGKTEMTRALAAEMKMRFYHVSAPEVSIEQLTGLPDFENIPEEHHIYSVAGHKNPKGTAWSCPEIIATANTMARDSGHEGCILLLDDLHESPLSTLSYFYQLLNEKKVSGWALDEAVYIVCAMNDSESANFDGLPSPIVNRMAIYDTMFDSDDFLEGYGVRFNYLIRSFLKGRGELLSELESTVKPYGTPRSWTQFNDSFEYMYDKEKEFLVDNLRAIASGSVSDQAAMDLQTHITQVEKLNLNTYVEEKKMINVAELHNLDKIMIGYIVNFVDTVADGQYLLDLLNFNIDQKSFTGFCASEIYLKFKNAMEDTSKLTAGLQLFLAKGLGIGEFKIENLGTLTPDEEKIVKNFKIENKDEFYSAVLPYI